MSDSTIVPLTNKGRRIVTASSEIRGLPPEGDNIAFLLSTLCQVGLPRSRPAGRVFERRSGSASLRVEAGSLFDGDSWVEQPLPYGTKPRLLLLHLIRSYLRTGEREIDLGDSARDFLQNVIGVNASGGKNGGLTGFRAQVNAFAVCRMMIGYNTPTGTVRTRQAEQVVEEYEAWPEPASSRQRHMWPGTITISETFARSIEEASVPLDARAIRAIQNSALALDLYAWLAHRLCRLQKPTVLYWAVLREQFGQEIADPKNFKKNFVKAMRDVLEVYPQAKVDDVFGGIKIKPSAPPVPSKCVIVPYSRAK